MRHIVFRGDYRKLKERQLLERFCTIKEGTKYVKGKEALKIGEIIWLVHEDKNKEKNMIGRAVVAGTFNNRLYNILASYASSYYEAKGQLGAHRIVKAIMQKTYKRKAKDDAQFTAISLVRLI